jgi:hypothetical protein
LRANEKASVERGLQGCEKAAPEEAAVQIGRPEGRRAKVEPRFRKERSREKDGVPASDERNGGEEIKGSRCGLIVAEATLESIRCRIEPGRYFFYWRISIYQPQKPVKGLILQGFTKY